MLSKTELAIPIVLFSLGFDRLGVPGTTVIDLAARIPSCNELGPMITYKIFTE